MSIWQRHACVLVAVAATFAISSNYYVLRQNKVSHPEPEIPTGMNTNPINGKLEKYIPSLSEDDGTSQTFRLSESLARVFPVWNHSDVPYSWCHRQGTGPTSGLLFVKIPKCASSTGMGVTISIGDVIRQRRIPVNGKPALICATRHDHGTASTGDRRYIERRKNESVLWSLVRHPASRALSDYFFFQVSRLGHNATEESILQHLGQDKWKRYCTNYLKLEEGTTERQELEHLIRNYDFLGVSERMSESMVVLSMILKVPLAAFILLPSKESGGYDDGLSPAGCVKIKKKWTTPKIGSYLAGEFLQNNSDYILYLAANASLDRTIDALGRDSVSAGVQLYHRLMEKNERACREQAIFPCPEMLPNHTILSQRSCYRSDTGCGHACTHAALRNEIQEEWDKLLVAV